MKVRKIYVDYEKEEIWLNEMSDKGYALVDYSFPRYTFEKCEPGEYTYRIELLDDLPSSPDSKDYLAFCEELGIEHVSQHYRWIFLRKARSQGPFEIFSDNSSKIAHRKKILALQSLAGLSCFLSGFGNILIGTYSTPNLIIGLFGVCIGLLLAHISYKNLKKIMNLKAL